MEQKKAGMGQLLFHEKKLPENLSGENRDAQKRSHPRIFHSRTSVIWTRRAGFSTKEDFCHTRNQTQSGISGCHRC
jgi:hypothetical protein